MRTKFTADTFILHLFDKLLSEEDQAAFLSSMNDIGFYFPDAYKIVNARKYEYPINKTFFGLDKKSKTWMLGNLFLYRYLWEFPGIVKDFLLAKKLLPTANLYHLLQLAHWISISPEFRFGYNHALMEYGWTTGTIYKFSPFSSVKEKYKKDISPSSEGLSTKVFSMFEVFAAGAGEEKPAKTEEDIIRLYNQVLNYSETPSGKT